MTRFKVEKPGLLTTVQDLGRQGWQAYGVSVSGAMDDYSLRLANLLVGNEPGEAGLECTLMGPELTFLDSCVFALAGADMAPLLNGWRIPTHSCHQAEKGDVLKLQNATEGMRTYIAFAGGLAVAPVMNSRSTYLRAGMGGFKGRKLMAGDVLSVGPGGEAYYYRTLCQAETVLGQKRETFRVVMGPEEDRFTPEGLETFLSETFVLSNQCDRMGYRLDGPVVEHVKGADILSGGITLGAVQVPGHGHPIIMMADRQTTGGYTKIANVATVDIPLLAQMKPGDPVRFEAVEVSRAQALVRERSERLEAVRRELDSQKRRYKAPRDFKVRVGQETYELSVREINEE